MQVRQHLHAGAAECRPLPGQLPSPRRTEDNWRRQDGRRRHMDRVRSPCGAVPHLRRDPRSVEVARRHLVPAGLADAPCHRLHRLPEPARTRRFARIAYAAAGLPVPPRTRCSVGGDSSRLRGPVPPSALDQVPYAAGDDGPGHSTQQVPVCPSAPQCTTVVSWNSTGAVSS